MKIRYVFVLPFFLLMSCASETQQKGLDEIEELWGDKIEFAKGAAAGSHGSGKYIEVEVKNSFFFEENTDRKGISGAIASIMYRNFSEEEKKDYEKLEVVLQDSTGSKEQEFEYPITVLEKFYKKEVAVKQIIQKLYERDYSFVTNSFAPIANVTVDTLEASFGPFLDTEGKLKSIITYQVSSEVLVLEDSSEYEIIAFKGKVVKDTSYSVFRVYMDSKSDSKDMIYINIK